MSNHSNSQIEELLKAVEIVAGCMEPFFAVSQKNILKKLHEHIQNEQPNLDFISSLKTIQDVLQMATYDSEKRDTLFGEDTDSFLKCSVGLKAILEQMIEKGMSFTDTPKEPHDSPTNSTTEQEKEVIVVVKKIFDDASLPEITGKAGQFDLKAYIKEQGEESEIIIHPGERKLVRTGLCFRVPQEYDLKIQSRRGLSYRKGIIVISFPQTEKDVISFPQTLGDELIIAVANSGSEPYSIRNGEIIAQGYIIKQYNPVFAVSSN